MVQVRKFGSNMDVTGGKSRRRGSSRSRSKDGCSESQDRSVHLLMVGSSELRARPQVRDVLLGNEAAAATRQVAGRMGRQGAGEPGYGWGGRRVRGSSREGFHQGRGV